jgi:hypothetical protein
LGGGGGIFTVQGVQLDVFIRQRRDFAVSTPLNLLLFFSFVSLKKHLVKAKEEEGQVETKLWGGRRLFLIRFDDFYAPFHLVSLWSRA